MSVAPAIAVEPSPAPLVAPAIAVKPHPAPLIASAVAVEPCLAPSELDAAASVVPSRSMGPQEDTLMGRGTALESDNAAQGNMQLAVTLPTNCLLPVCADS